MDPLSTRGDGVGCSDPTGTAGGVKGHGGEATPAPAATAAASTLTDGAVAGVVSAVVLWPIPGISSAALAAATASAALA